MPELFSRRYDVGPEMLLDFLQQALAAMPTVTSYSLDESGDQVKFATSVTLTSWGENMVASAEADGGGGSVLRVSGEPRMGALSTPWGEEMHAVTIETQLFAALDPSIALTRTNPIMMLQADHRRVEALFARIATTEGDVRADLVKQLVQALSVHMELEESHVYPLVNKEVDADLAEEAEVEHQLARDGISQLEELSPDEPGFDGALAMVVAGIEHHVAEEEQQAFPQLVAQLGADRLASLAEELTTARSELLERAAGTQKPEAKPKSAPRPPRPKREPERARTAPRNRRPRAKIDPDDTTKADLLDRAKKAGISGYSHMTKAELAKAITKAK